MLSGVAAAKTADELLARYGYPEAESVLDEWNYIRDWNDQPDSYIAMKNEVGASFYAAVLADLQAKTRVGVACLFEADVVKEFCGLFNVGEMWIGNHGRKASMAKTKGFYAFKAYNELYRLGEEIPVLTGVADGRSESVLHAAAAADRTGRFGILIANPSTEAGKLSLKWNEGLSGHAYLTDAPCTFGRLPEFDPDEIILPPHSFLYVGNTIRE